MEAQAAIHDLIGSILAASDSLLAGADQRAPSELDLLVIDYLRRRGLPEAAASVAERARLTPATSMPPIDTLESLVARGRGPAQVLHACLKALSALNRIAAAPTAVPPSSSSLPLPRGWNAARPISQPLTRDTLGTLSDSQHAAGRSTEPVRKKVCARRPGSPLTRQRRLYLGNLKSDASEGQLASFLSAGGPLCVRDLRSRR